jgi:peptide/nickel transport system permease protein
LTTTTTTERTAKVEAKPLPPPPTRESYITQSWNRFKKNPVVLFSSAVIGVIVIMAVGAPWLAPYPPSEIFYSNILSPPSAKFLLGTDWIGRDNLSLIIWGARPTLIVGVGATAFASLIGVAVGLVSGFFGGIIDTVLMRVAEIVYLIPALFFIIVLVSIFNVTGLGIVIFDIGILGWPPMARVVRSEVLSLRERPFIDASRAMGASNFRMMFKEIFPNVISPITVIATIGISQAILIEASLSFLGFTDPSITTWGKMVSVAYPLLTKAWWASAFPGFAIFVTVLAFSLLGDGLRDAFDVRI